MSPGWKPTHLLWKEREVTPAGSVLGSGSPQRPFPTGPAGASLARPGASRAAIGHRSKGRRSHRRPGPRTHSRGRVFPAHPAAHPPWRPRGSSLASSPHAVPVALLSAICPPSRLLSADHHPRPGLLTARASPAQQRTLPEAAGLASSAREDSNGHSVSLRQVPWLKQSRSPLPPHARSQPGLCNMYKVRRVHPPPLHRRRQPHSGRCPCRRAASGPCPVQGPQQAVNGICKSCLAKRVGQLPGKASGGDMWRPDILVGEDREAPESPSPRKGLVGRAGGALGSADHGHGSRRWPATALPACPPATSVGTGAQQMLSAHCV